MNASLKWEFYANGAHDAWGTTMQWHFATADYLSDHTEVPAAWEFRKSIFGSDSEAYEYRALEERHGLGDFTLAELEHFGNVLARYSSILKAEGRDY